MFPSALRASIFPACLVLTLAARGQEDSSATQMLTSSVGDLLRTSGTEIVEQSQRTDLADHAEQDVREALGVVHVITSEDIRNAHCRDLEEALMLVPSFSLGRDVDDVTGFGIRGQWAHEGKCLFLLNGMPLNESSYGIFGMGMRMPLDNVSRIEVLVGPGSVMHGGFAAMGTVNIITKEAHDGEGLTLQGSSAFANDRAGVQRGHLYGAHRLTAGTELGYSASVSAGSRFTGQQRMSDGMVLSYADSTRAQTLNGYFSIRRRNFRGQFFASDHTAQVSDMPYDLQVRTVMASAEQGLTIGRRSRLDLVLLHRIQLPWFYYAGAAPDLVATNTVDQRTQASAVLHANPVKWLHATIGTQSWLDRFRFHSPAAGRVFSVNGKERLTILDAALFGELRTQHAFGSFTAGLRGEHHNLTGTAAAPRFGYTGVFGRFHLKLMHSAAYKVPTMQNINVGPEEGIRREVVRAREAEVGYRLNSRIQFTAVLYHTLITDPIVYVYLGDTGLQDSYRNRVSSATEGIEFSFRHTGRMAGCQAAFSFYRVDRSRTDLPETSLNDSLGPVFQGLPAVKATLTAYVRTSQRDRISSQAIWSGPSHSYACSADTPSGLVLTSYKPWLRLGLFYEHSFARAEGLTAIIGCHNVLDQGAWIQSPYNNGLNSLPMNGREFVLRVEYRFAL